MHSGVSIAVGLLYGYFGESLLVNVQLVISLRHLCLACLLRDSLSERREFADDISLGGGSERLHD